MPCGGDIPLKQKNMITLILIVYLIDNISDVIILQVEAVVVATSCPDADYRCEAEAAAADRAWFAARAS